MNQLVERDIIKFSRKSKSTLIVWFFIYPGFLIYSARIFYEKFYLTWLYGPQMIGFSFVHTWGIIALYALLASLAIYVWLLICLLLLVFKKIDRRKIFISLFLISVLTGLPSYLPSSWIEYTAEKILGTPRRISEVYHAAESGNIQSLKTLIAHNAEIDEPYFMNQTPLMAAAQNGHIQIVQCLLDNGADINRKGDFGQTTLSLAFMHCSNREVLEVLLSHGANINTQDSRGRTLLMYATYANSLQDAQYVISKGANVNIKSYEGESALKNARKKDNLEMINLLLKTGAIE